MRLAGSLVPALGLILLVGCPKDEEHLRKANVLFKNGELDQAEAQYRAAAEADPERVAAWEGLGNVAFEREQFEAAIEHYRRAIALQNEAMSARHKLAVTLAEVGSSTEAIELLQETVQIDPQDAFAHHALGGLYRKHGDLDKAKKAQVAALAADESQHAARYALGVILVDLGELDEAEREFSRLAKEGKSPLADYGFARIAAKKERWADAARYLKRVLDAGASRPDKIRDDPVFERGWEQPEMKDILQALER